MTSSIIDKRAAIFERIRVYYGLTEKELKKPVKVDKNILKRYLMLELRATLPKTLDRNILILEELGDIEKAEPELWKVNYWLNGE